MRYTRATLAAATALLAITGLGFSTTAQADNHDKDHRNICIIEVKGNHNHNACGSIKYGENATTGSGHSVRTGLGNVDGDLTYQVYNDFGAQIEITCFPSINCKTLTGSQFIDTELGDGGSVTVVLADGAGTIEAVQNPWTGPGGPGTAPQALFLALPGTGNSCYSQANGMNCKSTSAAVCFTKAATRSCPPTFSGTNLQRRNGTTTSEGQG
ncbi:hypothetical protein [Streptomyces sp. NBC_01264]|uniref:hypothetical protein n=1 Tax=Streptomyces sp. NBC_01264 TaxID=2903804 RepID=UPI00224EA762|nr:hypothetical protein [Streptomyces sp. NBC_01264]MCX4784246.1 hypothetical protein [Streptomyces sp. NBC_01264]